VTVRHPKDVGELSTLLITAALRARGYAVSVPVGENTRYDLIADNGSRLTRVQCKTGRLRNGSVFFNTCSSYAHHPNPKQIKRDYLGEVDEFAVYCPDTCGVYLVPIEELPVRRTAALRVTPARNGQVKRIRLAAVYEIARLEID
jgi:hypothetical protein